MPLTKIGVCRDAFDIKNRGTVLGFHLYVLSGQVKHGERVLISCDKDGNEIGQYDGYFSAILSGKKHRRDMELYSISLDEPGVKEKILGATVYLHADIDIWLPDDERETT